ncbi:MAG: NAD(P)/FAD-dependent oxidoreductase [Clostridia bacterium]|nr:NAD(P)/FAD-dependent oxidoreductase [Clostridia bacterium]
MGNSGKSVIIIGAGLAGLSAGIYGQMNAYNTTIFEMHNIPGGYCTSWKRKGYTFDGAMDWLNGVNLNEKDSTVWKELGYLDGRKVAYSDEMLCVRDREGNTWSFHSDPEKLENELMKLTSYEEDKEIIRKLCKDISKLIKAPVFDFIKPEAVFGPIDQFKMLFKFLPYMKMLIYYNQVMVRDYAKQFKDPRLSEIISYMYFDPIIPQSQFTPVYQLAGMNKKLLGFPEGGGGGLAAFLEKRYKEMGGKLYCKARVKKILVEDNKAVGVLLQDGTKHYADVVISACDGRAAIYDMLDGKFVNEHVDDVYNKGPVYPSLLRVYLGVNRDFKNEPHSVAYLLNEPLDIPGLYQNHRKDSIMIRHYSNLDPSFAPPGKSVINSVFFADYDYWKELYKDKERYKKEKEKVASIVTKYLEQLYPGIKDQIEVVDVATPVTYERYTGNYRGSIKAWIEDTTDVPDKLKKVGMTLPGLNNFYMIGQWMSYGGMIRVATSGRYVIQAICEKDRKKFVTHTA